MSDIISNETKRILFKSGSYVCGIPKGDTSKWTISDWIYYIDLNGTWVQ